MATKRDSPPCDACGFAQANHRVLWLESTSDVLALRVPLHKIPIYGFLLGIIDAFLSFLGHLGFFLGRALGLITLTKDTSTATSDRSRLLWLEAERRSIPIEQILFLGRPTDTFRIRRGGRNRFFSSLPLPPRADALRMDDKVIFKRAMAARGLPVPRSYSVTNMRQAQKALKEIGLACVKPRTGSNGRHTYPFVRTEEELERALASVKEISHYASVEEHLEGQLCRATCVDGKMIGFLESAYPTVLGDGVSTIRELIHESNAKKAEGFSDIVIDASYEGYIERRGYSLDSVLPDGEALPLSYRGGVAAGGSNREHGLSIHPSFIAPIEEAARLTGLAIVGFDIIIPDPMADAGSQRWGFIEANSLPWIDLHASPFYGTPIDLSPAVWDLWEELHPVRGTR